MQQIVIPVEKNSVIRLDITNRRVKRHGMQGTVAPPGAILVDGRMVHISEIPSINNWAAKHDLRKRRVQDNLAFAIDYLNRHGVTVGAINSVGLTKSAVIIPPMYHANMMQWLDNHPAEIPSIEKPPIRSCIAPNAQTIADIQLPDSIEKIYVNDLAEAHELYSGAKHEGLLVVELQHIGADLLRYITIGTGEKLCVSLSQASFLHTHHCVGKVILAHSGEKADRAGQLLPAIKPLTTKPLASEAIEELFGYLAAEIAIQALTVDKQHTCIGPILIGALWCQNLATHIKLAKPLRYWQLDGTTER